MNAENFVTIKDLTEAAGEVFEKYRNNKKERKRVVMRYWDIRSETNKSEVAAIKTGKEFNIDARTVFRYVKEWRGTIV